MDRGPGETWALPAGHFPPTGKPADQLRFLVRYAVLAPSPRNAQPWHFEVTDSRMSLYADLSRHQPWADPDRRDLYISLGCALENLLLAAAHFGWRTQVVYFPLCEEDPLVAQVHFSPGQRPPVGQPNALFMAMARRRTHHGRYDAAPCGSGVLRKLMECCREEGLSLLLTEASGTKQAVNRLLVAADGAAMARPGYRAELAEALGAEALGATGTAARLQKLAVGHFGKVLAMSQRGALTSAPAFGLISASRPGRKTQLLAGRVLERLYLAAATLGLSLQPLSVLLNQDDAAMALAGLFPGRGFPLLPFRFGRAAVRPSPTPRRPLDEVVHDIWLPTG